MRKTGTFLVLVLVVSVLVAGCSGSTPTSVTAAQEAVCTALSGVKTAVSALDTISSTTTIAQVEEIQKGIESSVEALKTSVAAVPAAKVDGITTAIDGFKDTFKDMSPETTLGDAAAQVQTAAQGVTTAIEQAQSTLSCK